MANTTSCLLINGTGTAMANVGGNAAADVPAYSSLTITLSDAEVTAACTDATRTSGLAVIPLASATELHWIAKVLRVGRNPGA